MARVPTYDAPTQELRPLGAPRLDSVASPDLLGAPADRQLNTGKALLAAGTGAAAIAYSMKQRDDADSVFRAETAVKDAYLQQEQDWRKNRQGRFSKDLTVDAQKWWDDTLKTHAENLGNDDQRRLFFDRATRLRLQSMGAVSNWEAQQLERSHDEGWQADKNATISVAAAGATPEAVSNARAEITRLNSYQAARKGWEAAQLAGENMKDLTNLHTQVIQGLARDNPIAAQQYFEQNKKEIDGTRHAEISAFAEKVTANALGEKSAADVWEKQGPKDDRTPVELDKMEESLRSTLKGNEPALDSAVKRLRERVSAFKDARRERDDGLEAKVNASIMQGATRAQIAAMPEFNALSPESARKIDAFLENRDYTRVARAAAAESRADAAESRNERRLRREGLDVALRLSDPDRLAALSRDQVVNLLPVLGPELTTNLLAKYDSFAKNTDKLTEARIDAQDFQTIALEAGLRPNEKNKSEDEKDQLVRLQSRVETEIGLEQRAKNRNLSREEKVAVMRRVLDDKVIVSKTLWPDSAAPLALVPPDRLKDTYVVVDGKEIRLNTIPPADRAKIIQGRQARGLPINEQAIATTWWRAQQQRKPAAPASEIPSPTVLGIPGP